MANCKYQLNIDGNILKFDSDKQLSNFIKQNKIGKAKAIKYSTDLSNRQKVIQTAIKGEHSDGAYKNSSGLSIYNYLTKEHDIGNGPELLAPYFDQDKYIKNESAARLKKAEETGEGIGTIKEIEEEIRQELAEDDIMLRNGLSIHSIVLTAIEKGMSSAEVNVKITKFIDSIAAYKKVEYTKEQAAEYHKRVRIATRNFIDFVYTQGTPIVKPNLLHENGTVKDRPDLVVVDTHGTPHIIDLTLSRKQFSDWNSAKKINQDYKLGIFRQLAESIAPTKLSKLIVAPFVIQGMELDNFEFNAKMAEDRTVGNPALDYFGGSISKKLKTLLPSKFTPLHVESDAIDEKSEKLMSAMFPNYVAQSRFEKDKEGHIKHIKKTKVKDEPWILYDTVENKPIKIDKEEDIEKVVDDYMERYDKVKNTEVHKLYGAIQTAIQNDIPYIEFSKGKHKNRINAVLEQYLDGDWEVIDNPIFMNQGLIVFRNTKHNIIDAVSITANDLNAVYNFGLGTTLLGKFRNNHLANKDPKIKSAKTTNIETMRLLAILNNMPELFHGNKLGGLKVLNYMQNQSDYSDLEGNLHNFNQLFNLVTSKDEIDIPNNIEGGQIKVQDKFDYWYDKIMSHMAALNNPKLKGAGGTRVDAVDDKLKWLKTIQDKLVEQYSYLVENPKEGMDFKSKEQYLYFLVTQGIAYYSGFRASFDYGVPQIGVRGADFGHLLQTVAFGEGKEYNNKGEKVVGFMGGSLFRTSDDTGSDYLSEAHSLVTLGHDKIRGAYAKIQSRIIAKTNEYYEKAGRSGMEKVLLGQAEPYHEVFFEKVRDEKGNEKISNSFIYKNPYDMNANLKDYERDYLKFILWETFKFKRKLGPEFADMSVESMEKHGRFKEFTNDTSYLKAPLAKKTDLSKWSTTDTFRQLVGKRWEEMRDSLDPRLITEMQSSEIEDQVNTAYTMYNEFSITDDFRDKMIAEYGTQYFETNLDTMALKMVFSGIRENVMNDILPTINAVMTQMKYHGSMSGKSDEMKKALDSFYDQLKVSVYGVEPIKGEVAEPLKVVKQFQKLASVMYITFRPALMLKELITGTFKNVSYAWTKVYGDDSFTKADLKSAYSKVLFSKAQSPFDFNIVDNLNIHYGIANMDLNTIVHKTKTDRQGMFKFFSDNMYWFNNAPDYVNRMTLFVAKMIHDGCYDAHTIDKNGDFKYDPTKDKRFKKYFEKRKQYKYQFANNDQEYNDQRSLYITMLDDFNAENERLNLALLDEKTDLIPRAYTHKERESIKVFSDMAYGFYDHERSAMWKHTAIGSLFGQFLTYWPAKVKYYFGKESKGVQGKYEQKYTIDENGEKKFIYLKDVLDEDGNLEGTEETYENTGRKAMHFMGSPMEGLMYSLGLVGRDLVMGNFDKTPVERIRRAKLAIHDLVMGMLVLALLRVLFEQFNESGSRDEGYANQALGVTQKAFEKAMQEFDPFTSVFGAFSWEPAVISMMSNVKRDFARLFTGDTNVETFLRNNFKALEVIPEIMEEQR